MNELQRPGRPTANHHTSHHEAQRPVINQIGNHLQHPTPRSSKHGPRATHQQRQVVLQLGHRDVARDPAAAAACIVWETL